ncbi:hypothetical protein M378DRAFT_325740 [Amanita muscaria Koide BX008]|uniref:C2H2-type domain-containing protein n=1 Tax=Amanita muscaria (strain Koide BX008) TaxID=946122 RepID=A0A0C2XCF0_AMAMK|nr:hypothetical protein M378DRAFT_325740 [Amanita muscaria Koide BX008]
MITISYWHIMAYAVVQHPSIHDILLHNGSSVQTVMSSNNTGFLPNFTSTGASNNPRYPHNVSTPTSASLRKASAEQSICTCMPNPFSQEYPSNETEQTFPSLLFPSQTTFSHELSSCPQTISYGVGSLRQHGAMGISRCTQGSPLSFSPPPINHIRIPSSASMELSHGNNATNLVAFDNPMYPMDAYTFPDFTYNVVQEQEQDQHVFSGTNQVINDFQQLQPFIPGKKRSSVGVEYGFGDANMKFNNRQHLSSLSLANYPMPVRTSNVKAYSALAAQGQIEIQSSTGKASDSTSTKIKRHSTYSPSVSVDGTRWHCNGCEYTTEREQDMIRHCSTLRHGGRRFFECPSCGKRFSRKDSVTRHSKTSSCGLRRVSLSANSA